MRIKITNIDRHGLVFDISKMLLAHHLNIVSMEVLRNTTFLETESISQEKEAEVLREVRQITNVTDVEEIELMPHEEKILQSKVVIDAVTDGILSIDRAGKIVQYNVAAEKILHTPAAKAVGKEFMTIFPFCHSLLESIKQGTRYLNREVFVEKYDTHYLVSSHPVLDTHGKMIGGVAILKDINDVRKIYQQLTEQPFFGFDQILYTSKVMQELIAQAKQYADGDSTVLIRGETGTGKELFARALHSASPRQNNIFLAVNCAAIPDTLLESELFGYEEGAFTGASKGGKQGLFELANGGTLFLDEIGEISTHLQAKLLRVLQEYKVRRIGSRREIALNVRLLTATNRNLEEMIQDGDFREDLYYRLNVIPLFLPSLRERKEDIAVLAKAFLKRSSAKLGRDVKTISTAALEVLLRYDWPGNIRELENIIERAVNLVKGNGIFPEHIVFSRRTNYNAACAVPDLSQHKTLEQILEETEKRILQQALSQYRTSRKLGQLLGISHTSVIKKLHKYNLSPAEKA